MSVFTHGVIQKGKPRPINRNQVFTVVGRNNNPEKTANAYRNSPNTTAHHSIKGSVDRKDPTV
jgi:hypothetical protein